jgi:prepilin-type N-terminal cleavage/methylation domain-containing protein
MKVTLNRGFTYVELIMVIGIMGIIATFVTVGFPASQKRARDTRRMSDLKQWQTSLETYANTKNGVYPIFTSATRPNENALCEVLYPAENPPCPGPADPRAGTANCSSNTCNYQYRSDASGTIFVLYFPLEAPPDTANPYFIICSSGITGFDTGAPSSASCPL